jgi:hypothetical protein
VYTLTHAFDEKAPDGTSYNDLPFNWKGMTEEEFCKSNFKGGWTKMEHRQMYRKTFDGKRDHQGGMIDAQLFWFKDDTGVAMVLDYWKGKVSYYKFGCHHTLKHAKFSSSEPNVCPNCNNDISFSWMKDVTEDSGWAMNEHSSRPSRGIRDYDRSIKFNRVLSDVEIKAVSKFLATVDCPGWTGVHVRGTGPSYLFSTTYDSSD